MTSQIDDEANAAPPESVEPDDIDYGSCIISSEEEIDYEEIYESTQPDFEAGRYAFNSADYATHEEAMTALDAHIHSLVEQVCLEPISVPPPDAES